MKGQELNRHKRISGTLSMVASLGEVNHEELAAKVSLQYGLTTKKANEYIRVLLDTNKIVDNGGKLKVVEWKTQYYAKPVAGMLGTITTNINTGNCAIVEKEENYRGEKMKMKIEPKSEYALLNRRIKLNADALQDQIIEISARVVELEGKLKLLEK